MLIKFEFFFILSLLNFYFSLVIDNKIRNFQSTQFLFTNIKVDIERENNIYFLDGFTLPSDLIDLMPNSSFEIIINQGRLPQFYKEKFYFKKKEKVYQDNDDNYFMDNEKLIDYPSGYLFHSNNFSPFQNFAQFKNYFDIFTNIFKITLNPLLDRSSYITTGRDIFFFENNEKACTDHLDAIKEIIPHGSWNEFTDKINYDLFTSSDYKSIKYYLKKDNSSVKLYFDIIYKLDNNLGALDDKNTDRNFYNRRFLSGNPFNFNNLIYNNEIMFTSENTPVLEIVDLIPDQLDILMSTISIKIISNNKNLFFDCYNITQIFEININDSVEEQNPVVPFTYENKKTKKIYFRLKTDLLRNEMDVYHNMSINISYEVRKKLLNFESYENESEYGYKFPCGLIVFNYMPIPTNHVYFNMPCVDGTMPFNIIALTWVVFGFIFIQILNMFLGNKNNLSKTLWQNIKDRFMAKWGFLFGR